MTKSLNLVIVPSVQRVELVEGAGGASILVLLIVMAAIDGHPNFGRGRADRPRLRLMKAVGVEAGMVTDERARAEARVEFL